MSTKRSSARSRKRTKYTHSDSDANGDEDFHDDDFAPSPSSSSTKQQSSKEKRTSKSTKATNKKEHVTSGVSKPTKDAGSSSVVLAAAKVSDLGGTVDNENVENCTELLINQTAMSDQRYLLDNDKDSSDAKVSRINEPTAPSSKVKATVTESVTSSSKVQASSSSGGQRVIIGATGHRASLTKSPMGGLRLGLSRNARVQPLHVIQKSPMSH